MFLRTTERLLLRRFCAEDGNDLFEYLSDEEVVRYEPYLPHSREEANEAAKQRAENECFLAVCLKNGKLIGNLYLQAGDFGTWEIGYVFNRSFWGNGFAVESVRELLSYLFEEQNAHRVTAFCDPQNVHSWKLLERIGMRREGTLLQNVYFFTDEAGKPLWKDTYEYGMLRSDYGE